MREDMAKILKAKALVVKACSAGCLIPRGSTYYIQMRDDVDSFHELICEDCFKELSALLNIAGIRIEDYITEHLRIIE